MFFSEEKNQKTFVSRAAVAGAGLGRWAACWLYAASATLYGVVALLWFDDETWQNLAEIWAVPHGKALGAAVMLLLILGGLLLPFARTQRAASLALAFVASIFCAACLPGIVAAPLSYGPYVFFFEMLALVFGALAVTASSTPSPTLRRVCLAGIGLCTVSFTLAQIIFFQITVDLVPHWIPPGQGFWAVLTTIAFGLAALAMLANRQASLALDLTTLMTALFGILVWIPRLSAKPADHGTWSEFALSWFITAAIWLVADLHRPKAPTRPA